MTLKTPPNYGYSSGTRFLDRKSFICKDLQLEAGGIEPRTLDLQVLLGQALARIGNEGLASCLVLLCSDQDIALVVEAWPRLPASCKRLILDAVGERGTQ
jgi:hypothetical protein